MSSADDIGGECSTGDAILSRVACDTQRWQPSFIHAGDFLKTLKRRVAVNENNKGSEAPLDSALAMKSMGL